MPYKWAISTLVSNLESIHFCKAVCLEHLSDVFKLGQGADIHIKQAKLFIRSAFEKL